MINSLCLIVTKPLGAELSALGVRAAWACHQGGFATKLVYAEEGVDCLAAGEGYQSSMLADFIAADGEVFAVREDLARRGLDEAALPQGVAVVAAAQLAELCEECDTVNHF